MHPALTAMNANPCERAMRACLHAPMRLCRPECAREQTYLRSSFFPHITLLCRRRRRRRSRQPKAHQIMHRLRLRVRMPATISRVHCGAGALRIVNGTRMRTECLKYQRQRTPTAAPFGMTRGERRAHEQNKTDTHTHKKCRKNTTQSALRAGDVCNLCIWVVRFYCEREARVTWNKMSHNRII